MTPPLTERYEIMVQNWEKVDVPPSLAGLLMLLPPPGCHWDVAARDRWLAALKENLELNYPIRDAVEVNI